MQLGAVETVPIGSSQNVGELCQTRSELNHFERVDAGSNFNLSRSGPVSTPYEERRFRLRL